LIASVCRIERPWAAILSAADISTSGLLGMVRIQGFKAVAAHALRAWMQDDSADLSKTMAGLDKALARAEKLAGYTGFLRHAEAEPAA